MDVMDVSQKLTCNLPVADLRRIVGGKRETLLLKCSDGRKGISLP